MNSRAFVSLNKARCSFIKDSVTFVPLTERWALRTGVRNPVEERYETSPESIQPFWISREPVAWPWCNFAASQRRSYCASMNSPSPVGLVNRQWETVDLACVLCDRRIQNDRASRPANLHQCACSFYSSCAGSLAKHCITQVCQHPYSPGMAPCDFWFFPKLNCRWKWGDLWCGGHTVHKLS